MCAKKKPTIIDIAKTLGISPSTVHRALTNHPKTTALTKSRVLQMARKLGYKPNLAARYLSSKRPLHISVNTLSGTTSFWDEVRAGIEEERASLDLQNVELNFRTYPLEEGEESAFGEALEENANGIILFPSHPEKLRTLMRRAARKNVPVVFIATDAPTPGRLAVVSVDTQGSGSLAADLMGRILGGRGEVGVTLFDAEINEHAEKFQSFKETIQELYPAMRVHDPIEDHDDHELAYQQCRKFLTANPGVTGLYVTTELSMPVIQAAKDLGRISKLTIVTTDLFPELVAEIRAGTVAATLFQRPRTQGRVALRILYHFLVEGECPAGQVSFTPHLVMRGNLKSFLEQQGLTQMSEDPGRPSGRS